jgi:hypothetical protein
VKSMPQCIQTSTHPSIPSPQHHKKIVVNSRREFAACGFARRKIQ